MVRGGFFSSIFPIHTFIFLYMFILIHLNKYNNTFPTQCHTKFKLISLLFAFTLAKTVDLIREGKFFNSSFNFFVTYLILVLTNIILFIVHHNLIKQLPIFFLTWSKYSSLEGLSFHFNSLS